MIGRENNKEKGKDMPKTIGEETIELYNGVEERLRRTKVVGKRDFLEHGPKKLLQVAELADSLGVDFRIQSQSFEWKEHSQTLEGLAPDAGWSYFPDEDDLANPEGLDLQWLH